MITAAGHSSRMGRPKALLDWHGEPLIAHQCRTLRGFARIVVVLGAGADEIREALATAFADDLGFAADVTCVDNPNFEAGRSTSIEAGMKAVGVGECDAVLIAAVDQPLQAEVIGDLLAAFDAEHFAVAVPTFDARRGHPILLAARAFDDLRACSREEMGLRNVVYRYAAQTIEVPVNSPEILRDLNTPDDYREASGDSTP